jgi:UDP-3-O-[3-hydroxymyristoyl] glucosamine N-acyltransferase
MIQLKDILNTLEGYVFLGQDTQIISDVIVLDKNNKNENAIMWCNTKNENLLYEINTGTIICNPVENVEKLSKKCNFIFVSNPRRIFQKTLINFFSKSEVPLGVAMTAIIHQSVQIGKNTAIGHHCIIEENCVIGHNCEIGHNTVIKANTIIGNNVKIGCNNTIGGVGFGYEVNEEGTYELIPHIGKVEIKDRVEIGNNTTIDRAVLGSTILEEDVKVDNLVHIAHNVIIGKNSLIIANAMIGGSTIVGQNVWVAPSVSLLNKLSIGDDSLMGMGAVVIKNVENKAKMVGNPAKKIN